MSENHDKEKPGDDPLSAWMKTAGDLWGNMFRTWSDAAAAFRPSAASSSGASGHAQASLNAAMKTWQVLSSTLARPEIMDSMFKGSGTMPEILMKLAQSSLAGFLEFQQKWVERAGRIGKSTEAYTFEDLDENAFRAWNEIYEKEFRQFFNIPQLGLTRFYQGKPDPGQIQRVPDSCRRVEPVAVSAGDKVIQRHAGEARRALRSRRAP